MNSIQIKKRVKVLTPMHKALYNYIKNNTPDDTIWGLCYDYLKIPSDLREFAEQLWEENAPSDEEIMQYIDDNEFDSIEDSDIIISQGDLIVIYELWFDDDDN